MHIYCSGRCGRLLKVRPAVTNGEVYYLCSSCHGPFWAAVHSSVSHRMRRNGHAGFLAWLRRVIRRAKSVDSRLT